MTDVEIGVFLRANPVTARKGSLIAGRHRAAAMFGRLLREETYIPVAYHRG